MKGFLIILLLLFVVVVSSISKEKSLKFFNDFDTAGQYTNYDKHVTESNGIIYFLIRIDTYQSNNFFYDIVEYSKRNCKLINFYETVTIGPGYSYIYHKYLFDCSFLKFF